MSNYKLRQHTAVIINYTIDHVSTPTVINKPPHSVLKFPNIKPTSRAR